MISINLFKLAVLDQLEDVIDSESSKESSSEPEESTNLIKHEAKIEVTASEEKIIKKRMLLGKKLVLSLDPIELCRLVQSTYAWNRLLCIDWRRWNADRHRPEPYRRAGC